MARGLKIADLAFLGRVGAGGSFTPPQSANLVLWTRPEELEALYANNDPIAAPWPDVGGQGHDMATGGAPVFHTNVLNGRGAPRFTGGITAFTSVPAPTFTSSEYTIFCVSKFDAAAGTQATVFTGGFNIGFSLLKNTGNRQIAIRDPVTPVFQTDAASTANGELWSAVKTAAPLTRLFINTASAAITNDTGVMGTPESLITFGNIVGTASLIGYIFEVLLWDIPLSDVERQSVETYLMNKYAL